MSYRRLASKHTIPLEDERSKFRPCLGWAMNSGSLGNGHLILVGEGLGGWFCGPWRGGVICFQTQK